MAEGDDSGQDRTEDATARRESQAREKGQVARSREFVSFMVLMTGGGIFILLGAYIGDYFLKLLERSFSIERHVVFDTFAVVQKFSTELTDSIIMIVPILLALMVVGVASAISIGGLGFSPSSLAPDLKRIDPIKGLKKIFSVKGLIELLKAVIKFAIVGTVAGILIMKNLDYLSTISNQHVKGAIIDSFELVALAFLLFSLALIVIVIIDVPFQIIQHKESLKMTKQEVKDENKEVEGQPEVKQKLRQRQQEISQARMMQDVPTADVVITNPTHYAVALTYDETKEGAPRVVAKGADLIAMQIQRVAKSNDVPVLQVPPLARAIYHTTELKAEIPSGLYIAVAQILAYLFQLRRFKSGKVRRPKLPEQVPIPDEYQY